MLVHKASYNRGVAVAISDQTKLDRLIALRDEAKDLLMENDDFRMFLALEHAIAEIVGDAPAKPSETSKPAGNGKAAAAPVDIGNLSQADASHILLTRVLKEPVIIANLVRALGAHGINVGGSNPNINLSSVLSKDGRFRSVRYKDRASWWVTGTPFPGELDVH
jgi:hypothetical protein